MTDEGINQEAGEGSYWREDDKKVSLWSSAKEGRRRVKEGETNVERDVREITDLLNLGTGEAKGADIPEDKVKQVTEYVNFGFRCIGKVDSVPCPLSSNVMPF